MEIKKDFQEICPVYPLVKHTHTQRIKNKKIKNTSDINKVKVSRVGGGIDKKYQTYTYNTKV